MQWLVIKLVLTTMPVESLGSYFFYLSCLAPIFMLFTGHFKNYATQKSHGDWPIMFLTRCWQVVSILGILMLAVFVELHTTLFLIVVLIKLFEVLLDTRQALEIRQQNYMWPVAMIMAILMLVLVTCLFLLTNDLLDSGFSWQAVLLGSLCFVSVVLILFSLPTSQGVQTEFTSATVKDASQTLFKNMLINVGLQAALVALIAALPRMSLEWLVDSTALAIFGSMSYFYLLAHIITISLFQSGIRQFEKAEPSNVLVLVKTSLLKLIGVGLLALLIATYFHQEIIELVFSTTLVAHSFWLPWFVGFIIFAAMATYLEQSVIWLLSNSYLLKLNTTIFVGAMILCPIFVSMLGLMGAVIYMYVLFIVKVMALLFYLNKVSYRGKLAV